MMHLFGEQLQCTCYSNFLALAFISFHFMIRYVWLKLQIHMLNRPQLNYYTQAHIRHFDI